MDPAVDEVEAVVIGAGVIGLAAARALALAGHEVVVLERAYTIGFETSSRNSEVIHGGLYYPAGQPEGHRLRRRPRAPLRLLRRARRAARAARQADRRDRGGRDPRRREDRGGVPRQRRHQSRMADRLGGPASRTRAELRRGAVVALDRHHRQPCADARLSGRGRGSRRLCRVPLAGAGRTGRAAGRVRARCRRRRARDDPLPYPGQRRRPPRAGAGARDRRRAAGDDPAGLFLPRRLFHAARARRRSAG